MKIIHYICIVRLRDMRKTIEVKGMLEWANKQLSRVDAYATDEFKAGICTMIESLLMKSGNYKGYMNLPNRSEYSRVYYMSHKL
jgi:hypothetical protein